LPNIPKFIITEENSPLSTFSNVLITTFFNKHDHKVASEREFSEWVNRLKVSTKKEKTIFIADGFFDLISRCNYNKNERANTEPLVQFALEEIRTTNSNLFIVFSELYSTVKAHQNYECAKLISAITTRENLLVSCNPALYNTDFNIRLPRYDISEGSAIFGFGGRYDLIRYGRYE
jgi:hypothetical protein